MRGILDYNYGWYFAIAVVAISMVAILYGLTVIGDIRADLSALRAEGKNGILVGLTLVSLKLHILRLGQLTLFAAAGVIVLGVQFAGAPPEGLLLSVSRSLTLVNVCLTAGALLWGQAVRRQLAAAEAKRQQSLSPAAAPRVVITAKDAHDAAVIVEIKAAEAVVVAEGEVLRADAAQHDPGAGV